MRLGFRGQLVLISLAFLVIGGLAGYLFLDAKIEVLVAQLQIDDAAARSLKHTLSRTGLIGVGITIVVALIMSFLASHLFARSLNDVVTSARGALKDTDTREGGLETLRGSVTRLVRELKSAVSELTEERDRVRAVLAGISDGVLALNDKREVIFANEAAERLLGKSTVGRPLVELIRHPETLALVEGDEIGEAEATSGERTLLIKRGEDLEGGGFVLILLDVSRQRRLERVRTDFIANVSHELRTPVSIIQANAESLLDGGLERPERAPQLVERTHRASQRLSSLINDLLDLTRAESGAEILELRPQNVREILESIVGAVSAEGVRVEVEADTVTADRSALERALVNLVQNAVLHGGDEICLRAAEKGGHVTISVEDNGPGIPEAHRERIFERFYRVSSSRDRKSGGTGLGLAIVKHLILQQNGRVGYRPRPGGGSVFWVQLAGPQAR